VPTIFGLEQVEKKSYSAVFLQSAGIYHARVGAKVGKE
jgi:hypothetical protein